MHNTIKWSKIRKVKQWLHLLFGLRCFPLVLGSVLLFPHPSFGGAAFLPRSFGLLRWCCFPSLCSLLFVGGAAFPIFFLLGGRAFTLRSFWVVLLRFLLLLWVVLLFSFLWDEMK